MRDSSSRSTSRAPWRQLAVAALIVAAVLLRPRLQEWLDTVAPSPETVDVDSGTTSTEPDAADLQGDLNPDIFTGQPRQDSSSGHDRDTTTARSAPQRSTPAASDSRESGDAPPPGRLTEIRPDVFRSTAGLIFGRGSRDRHRLKHILKHTQDDLSKPIHGVFRGDRDQVLKWLDQAWTKTQDPQQQNNVRSRNQNHRTAWTIRMDQVIGYVGGQAGQRRKQPDCRYLRIVVEQDGVTIVTAYPTESF